MAVEPLDRARMRAALVTPQDQRRRPLHHVTKLTLLGSLRLGGLLLALVPMLGFPVPPVFVLHAPSMAMTSRCGEECVHSLLPRREIVNTGQGGAIGRRTTQYHGGRKRSIRSYRMRAGGWRTSVTHTGDRERAEQLLHEALREQMAQRYEEAAGLYLQSIAECPTAEAHTYLGWTYSFLGRLEEAIRECHEAIRIDPTFGNPYNDIGSYLMKQGRLEEAIDWLEKAKVAPRYEPRHYPYLNLARLYMALGRYEDASREFGQARFLHQSLFPETPTPEAGDAEVVN